jgi:uncharacterized membrane protein
MPFVEQSILINAPMTIVMEALNDVERIPSWATVTGTIDNVQGTGPGMTYEWHYSINRLNFSGKSEVIEQTEDVLITKTTGDVDSIWTINLTPVGKQSTAMQITVEYSPPNIFIEILADLVLQQLSDPEVAKENIKRFKEMTEARVKVMEEQIIADR